MNCANDLDSRPITLWTRSQRSGRVVQITGSKIAGSSLSGLFTRFEIGHIRKRFDLAGEAFGTGRRGRLKGLPNVRQARSSGPRGFDNRLVIGHIGPGANRHYAAKHCSWQGHSQDMVLILPPRFARSNE
jgi:hypothetical protein